MHFSKIAILSVITANAAFAQNTLQMSLTGAHGVSGSTSITYNSATTASTTIAATFDFSAFTPEAYTDCAGATVTAFSWHIHTAWTHGDAVLESATCSADETEGHYNPLNSDNSQCSTATKDGCEVGDLSGRYGLLTPDVNGIATLNAVDPNFYPFEAVQTGMSIVMHVGASDVEACTGTRIVCGRMDNVVGDYLDNTAGCQRRLRTQN